MVYQVKTSHTETANNYNINFSLPRITSNTKFYIRQKVAAIVLFLIGLIIPIIADHSEATACLFFIPIAICLFCTKQKVFM